LRNLTNRKEPRGFRPRGGITGVIPENLHVLFPDLFSTFHLQPPYLLREKVEVAVFEGKRGKKFHVDRPGKSG